MSRIAIIGITNLEAFGLKALFESHPHFMTRETSIRFFTRYEGNGMMDKMDFFIVDASIFAMHTDFFVPRKTRVVIVTRNRNDSFIGERMKNRNGLRFIYGDSTEEEMTEVIGEILAEPDVSQEISGELSVREKEVLKELASGKTNKEIADQLSISVNTVITHRKNISSKLGIKSVSGLSLYALMNGVI